MPAASFSAAPAALMLPISGRSFAMSAWFGKLKPFMSMPGALVMR